MAKKVYSKEERHEQAVKIGIQFGKQVGLARVSIGSVAAKLGVTAPLLFHVFGSREGFHKAITKGAKAAGVVFPEAQPTVRAARAERRAEREKTVKALSKGAKPKLKAPKKVAAKKPKLKAPKVAAPAKKAVKPKVKAPAKKAAAKPKVKAPKVVAPKFPVMPPPTAAQAPAAAA